MLLNEISQQNAGAGQNLNTTSEVLNSNAQFLQEAISYFNIGKKIRNRGTSMPKETPKVEKRIIKTSSSPQKPAPQKPTSYKPKKDTPVKFKPKTPTSSTGFDLNMLDKTDDSDFIKF